MHPGTPQQPTGVRGAKAAPSRFPAHAQGHHERAELCYQFLNFFFFWLLLYLKKRKGRGKRSREDSLLIHTHILTCPNVQLQQCLILPPVENLLHSRFPFAFGKWRLENAPAAEPLVPCGGASPAQGRFSPTEGRPDQGCHLGWSKGWLAHLLRRLTWGFSTEQPFLTPLYTSL